MIMPIFDVDLNKMNVLDREQRKDNTLFLEKTVKFGSNVQTYRSNLADGYNYSNLGTYSVGTISLLEWSNAKWLVNCGLCKGVVASCSMIAFSHKRRLQYQSLPQASLFLSCGSISL